MHSCKKHKKKKKTLGLMFISTRTYFCFPQIKMFHSLSHQMIWVSITSCSITPSYTSTTFSWWIPYRLSSLHLQKCLSDRRFYASVQLQWEGRVGSLHVWPVGPTGQMWGGRVSLVRCEGGPLTPLTVVGRTRKSVHLYSKALTFIWS